MPIYSQGDIFKKAQEKDLTIVFGRLGFSQIGAGLRTFWYNNKLNKKRSTRLITLCRQQAIEFQPNRWIWFVHLKAIHGFNNEELTQHLDQAIQWAVKNKLKTIITNGVKDVYPENSNIHPPGATRRRVNFIRKLAKEYEQKHSLNIELISQSDCFSQLNQWVKS